MSSEIQSLSFGPNPPTNPALAVDYINDVSSIVVDDGLVEGDEGFVLLLEFDPSNNPADTVQVSNAATLVTIRDNDGEGSMVWALSCGERLDCRFRNMSNILCATTDFLS